MRLAVQGVVSSQPLLCSDMCRLYCLCNMWDVVFPESACDFLGMLVLALLLLPHHLSHISTSLSRPLVVVVISPRLSRSLVFVVISPRSSRLNLCIKLSSASLVQLALAWPISRVSASRARYITHILPVCRVFCWSSWWLVESVSWSLWWLYSVYHNRRLTVRDNLSMAPRTLSDLLVLFEIGLAWYIQTHLRLQYRLIIWICDPWSECPTTSKSMQSLVVVVVSY